MDRFSRHYGTCRLTHVFKPWIVGHKSFSSPHQIAMLSVHASNSANCNEWLQQKLGEYSIIIIWKIFSIVCHFIHKPPACLWPFSKQITDSKTITKDFILTAMYFLEIVKYLQYTFIYLWIIGVLKPMLICCC